MTVWWHHCVLGDRFDCMVTSLCTWRQIWLYGDITVYLETGLTVWWHHCVFGDRFDCMVTSLCTWRQVWLYGDITVYLETGLTVWWHHCVLWRQVWLYGDITVFLEYRFDCMVTSLCPLKTGLTVWWHHCVFGDRFDCMVTSLCTWSTGLTVWWHHCVLGDRFDCMVTSLCTWRQVWLYGDITVYLEYSACDLCQYFISIAAINDASFPPNHHEFGSSLCRINAFRLFVCHGLVPRCSTSFYLCRNFSRVSKWHIHIVWVLNNNFTSRWPDIGLYDYMIMHWFSVGQQVQCWLPWTNSKITIRIPWLEMSCNFTKSGNVLWRKCTRKTSHKNVKAYKKCSCFKVPYISVY